MRINLSIIIPIAPGEQNWRPLLADLRRIPPGAEIVLVSVAPLLTIPEAIPGILLRQVIAAPGRAAHLNAGAQAARGDYLWFLHADSRLTEQAWPALEQSICRAPNALLFFDLAFLDDASVFVKINEWCAFWRSRLLKIPFGDQGFCLSRATFEQIGGYPLDAPYGEDHLFVWKAKAMRIAIEPVGVKLLTSARKYQMHGWLNTTALHQYLWYKQVWQVWTQRHSTNTLLRSPSLRKRQGIHL